MAQVVSYRVKWNLNSHTGQIYVHVPSGSPQPPYVTSYVLTPTSPQEMQMLVDLLRNEKPIQYDTSTKELQLGEYELVGEGEA